MTYAIPSYVRENLYILETMIMVDEDGDILGRGF